MTNRDGISLHTWSKPLPGNEDRHDILVVSPCSLGGSIGDTSPEDSTSALEEGCYSPPIEGYNAFCFEDSSPPQALWWGSLENNILPGTCPGSSRLLRTFVGDMRGSMGVHKEQLTSCSLGPFGSS